MEASSPARVLVVANRTAATPKLLEVVRQRAARGRCTFTLLVPALAHVVDPDNVVVERTLPLALPLIEEAAGSPVKGLIGDSDPVRTVSEAIGVEHFEEVIVSTLPQRVSHWLHRDVPGPRREARRAGNGRHRARGRAGGVGGHAAVRRALNWPSASAFRSRRRRRRACGGRGRPRRGRVRCPRWPTGPR
jgi:hypothetical protein